MLPGHTLDDLSDEVLDYDFSLPESLIAQRPVEGQRDTARLLLVRREPETGMPRFEDLKVSDLPHVVRENPCLKTSWIRNCTKVLPARFYVLRNDSSEHEVVLLEEVERNIWRALVRKQARFKYPQVLKLREDTNLTITSPSPGLIDLSSVGMDVETFLQKFGEMPLPPYIRERHRGKDIELYQNPFAKSQKAESVAAPTASLHFTEQLTDRMQLEGVCFSDLYLHVGLGTFEPVRTQKLSQSQLHFERVEVPNETLMDLEKHYSLNHKRESFVCVGTTAMRSLESLGLGGDDKATGADLEFDGSGNLKGRTNIFIRPGFKIRYTRALLTNFHLPQSTLLVLVSCFARSRLLALEAYKHAVSKGYRFFSYGDASLWI